MLTKFMSIGTVCCRGGATILVTVHLNLASHHETCGKLFITCFDARSPRLRHAPFSDLDALKKDGTVSCFQSAHACPDPSCLHERM